MHIGHSLNEDRWTWMRRTPCPICLSNHVCSLWVRPRELYFSRRTDTPTYRLACILPTIIYVPTHRKCQRVGGSAPHIIIYVCIIILYQFIYNTCSTSAEAFGALWRTLTALEWHAIVDRMFASGRAGGRGFVVGFSTMVEIRDLYQ